MVRLALLLVLAVPFAAASPAAAKSPLREPAAGERAALKAKYRDQARTELAGICVVRAHPRYAAIFVEWKKAGVEGTVYKRGDGRWRKVTSGSDWPGKGPVKTLLKGFRAPCGRSLR